MRNLRLWENMTAKGWKIINFTDLSFLEPCIRHFYFLLSQKHIQICNLGLSIISIREGNGTPRQYSCLENPMDEGAWWAAVYGVRQSRTQLKWLSSSSSIVSMQPTIFHQRVWQISNVLVHFHKCMDIWQTVQPDCRFTVLTPCIPAPSYQQNRFVLLYCWMLWTWMMGYQVRRRKRAG